MDLLTQNLIDGDQDGSSALTVMEIVREVELRTAAGTNRNDDCLHGEMDFHWIGSDQRETVRRSVTEHSRPAFNPA
jgi:hypothetical protein